MDHVSRKVGIQVGLHTFTDIDYADDVTLFVDTQDKYLIALAAMDEEASKFGLHVSWSKTKIQNLSCGSTTSPVVVNGNTVEPVQDFTYLGSIQTSNRNSSSECTGRIGLATGVMKHLDHIWNQPNLTMPTKICIYSTCVLAVLLYGSETWTLTQADWKRLDSFHTQCQRRILHTRWYDFVPNSEVLCRTSLLAASSIVRKRRLGLFGHVARLAEDVSANQILRTCCEAQDGARPSPDWKCARDRPPITWIHQICRDTGISVTDALQLAEARSFWRQITTAECYG